MKLDRYIVLNSDAVNIIITLLDQNHKPTERILFDKKDFGNLLTNEMIKGYLEDISEL